MRNARVGVGFVVLTAIGCGNVQDNPYESCTPGDSCSNVTACLTSTLPSTSGYVGSVCTMPCTVDADCLQDLNNYAAVCYSGQCYIQCVTVDSPCPYGTPCLSITNSPGNTTLICSP